VITAAQRCIEIAQHRIDPVKLRFFHGSTTATADDSLMCTSCLCDDIVPTATNTDEPADRWLLENLDPPLSACAEVGSGHYHGDTNSTLKYPAMPAKR